MHDCYGRRINYLRISVTDLCNLRCKYCMPEKGIPQKKHQEILRNEDIERIVKAAARLGCDKVRLTGGEPLVRKGLIDLIRNLGKIEAIKDMGLTTNGILLKKYADDLKKAGLTRVNISIDSLDRSKYADITRGGNIDDVLEGIRAVKEAGLEPLKINTVLIGNYNDDEIEDFVALTEQENIEVRFIELMPFGEASSWDKEHFISNTEVLTKVQSLIPVAQKKQGGVARYYKLPGAKGKVGLISPISNHFCNFCNRIRITADGKLKPCLHSNVELDIKNYNENMEQFLIDGIKAKPLKHQINNVSFEPVLRNMNEIGG